MATLNNVNVGILERVAEEAKTDKSKVKRSQKIDGEWLLEEGGPQFRAEVSFEGGKIVPAVEGPYSLSEVPEALRLFSRAEQKGRIVIAIRQEQD